MKSFELTTALLAAGLLSMPLGCAGGGGQEDTECRGTKCDDLDLPDSEIEEHACDSVMKDMSGRNLGRLVNRLNDPLANLALKAGDGCPTTFADIMDKLRETDAEGCEGEEAGITTRAVSETAQLTEQPTNYRLVTSRTCGGRDTKDLLFSLFGVPAGASSLPSTVEVIAFDESQGVFNYYEATGGEIEFFGNSKDMLKGSPDGRTRRCASCHTGGGLIMKELDTPWLHWEGHEDTPGAQELVDAHADLGSKATGLEFEGLVKGANREWNETRLEHLKETGSAKEILRPLFCTVEINLDNGADFYSPADHRNDDGASGCNHGEEAIKHSSCSNMSRIPFDSLLDPQLKGFGSISVDFADYQALIESSGQRVADRSGRAHTTKFGNETIDTIFDYVFVERAAADDDYVEKLISAGIVDEELVKDILMVDFTRPIFSDDRCGLLDFAPVLSSGDLNPAALREGFIANLGSPSPGSPEAELLSNLQNSDVDHDAKVDAFTAACEGLGSAAFLENAYTVTTLNRRTARQLPVMEFPETVPTNDLDVAPGTRLHPETCELTTEFVSVAVAASSGGQPEPEPEPEPEPTGNACAHSPCEEGPADAPLDPTCDDERVADVCGDDPFCCNTDWDNVCVEATTGCN